MKVNIIGSPTKQLIQLSVGAPFRLPQGVHPERLYVRPFCQGPMNVKTSFPCPCISDPSHSNALLLLGEQLVETLCITSISAHIESTPPSS